jgi:hypothetical protein
MEPTFKRFFAKYVVRSAVATVAATATKTAVTSVVDVEEESFSDEALNLGCTVTGVVVALQLGRRTDALVDRIADWRVNRKTVETASVLSSE